MTKKLARLLRADIQETSDLKSIAAMLAGKGRGGDTLLAHITPKEVGLLKEAGGAGTVNPDTGLLEFYDWTGTGGVVSGYDGGGGGYTTVGDSYYDSLPAATPGVYGKDASSDYYQVAPETYTTVPSYDYAGQAGYANVPDVPIVPAAPAAARTYANEPYEQGFVGSDALAAGISPMPQPPASDSLLKKYVGDPLKDLKASTGLSLNDLLRIGGAGAGALVGRRQNKEAAKQIQQATQEQKNLGLPYQERGRNLMRSAESGELTPQGQQALEAARAQAAQNVSKTGGVGVAQAQAQIEALRQNLLQNQYNFGLQVSQIGDQITLGAIRTGMQLDQQLNQSSQQFYTQLAQIAGGGTYGYGSPQPRG